MIVPRNTDSTPNTIMTMAIINGPKAGPPAAKTITGTFAQHQTDHETDETDQ